MTADPRSNPDAPILDTSAGAFELQVYRLGELSVLHTGTVLTDADEQKVIIRKTNRMPYGVALWPSSIALAHEIASRPGEFAGKAILELGAGTGLPGIVAASLGATVVQTDQDELVLHLCEMNGRRNGVEIAYRQADWTTWADAGRYEWILGADILYGESLHPKVRGIFEGNLAEGGMILLSDPFRPMSLRFMEGLERDGWGVRFNKWDVEEKSVAVFELMPPG